MAEKSIERQVAYKVPLALIFKGIYIKDEDKYMPSYIEYQDKKISRVNVIGVVLSTNKEDNSLVLDDGTSKISARYFDNTNAVQVSVGDIVNIIGKPRVYNDDRYIAIEIIKRSSAPWMKLHMAEISGIEVPAQEEKQEQEEETDEQNIVPAGAEQLIDYIKRMDKGSGVDIDVLIKECRIPDCEKIIQTMLKEGDLFENLPGKIKLLE